MVEESARPDAVRQKAELQRQACYDLLIDAGCSEPEAHEYKTRLMHRLILTGWHLGKEIGRERIIDHLQNMRAIESDPKTHQMKQIQDREPPPVANEGGGSVSWEKDRLR
jgi:hypothetical protein